MIFWHTDNQLSKIVASAFKEAGVQIDHINNFTPQPSIFYGIHRGTGIAMHLCSHTKNDYYYVDNGYFDAEYVDRSGRKNTYDGFYRIVKNGMIEPCPFKGVPLLPNQVVENILLIPPSPYSAFWNNTTPEDFIQLIGGKYPKKNFTVRTKEAEVNIADDIARHHAVIAFNSMAIMTAIAMRKPVMDTHGILRNGQLNMYSISDMEEFYRPKQFTLQEIAGGEWKN